MRFGPTALRTASKLKVATPYKLEHEQLVPRALHEVFSFFSRSENLEAITPAWLHFSVLSVAPQPLRKGTIIRYKLRVRGVPLRWTSEIVEWRPPHKFVDVQRKGPYKLWHHTHLFSPKALIRGSGMRCSIRCPSASSERSLTGWPCAATSSASLPFGTTKYARYSVKRFRDRQGAS
jgi:hypothetical protein